MPPQTYTQAVASVQAAPAAPFSIDVALHEEEMALQDFPLCRGLLVILYQRPDLLIDTASKLTDGDFDVVGGVDVSMIFRGMKAMAARRMVFDQNGLLEVLRTDATHTVMATWAVIADTRGVEIANYASRLTQIRRRAGIVRLHRLARTIQKGLRVDESVEVLTSRMSAAFGNVLVRYGDPVPPVDLSAAMADVMNPASPNIGISCPSYPLLSGALSGFSPGDMTMLWARTKLGKSLFCLRTALSFAAANVPILYIDTEMTERIFALRASAMLSGVGTKKRLLPENAAKMAVMRAEWERVHPWISYRSASSWNTMDVVAAIRDFRRRLGMGGGIVIYDWFRLPAGDLQSSQQQYQTLTLLSQELKKAAMECKLPILAAGQQNRGAIGCPLEDMIDGVEKFAGGSDGVAQYSSCSIAIYPAPADLIAAMAADKRWADKHCPVSHVLAVGGNRMGDSGTLIPMTRGDDLVFGEVSDPDVIAFVRDLSNAKKAERKVAAKSSRPPVPPAGVARAT